FSSFPLLNYYEEGETYILTGKSDELWAFISGKNPDELSRLLVKYDVGTPFFSSVEDWMKPLICRINEPEWDFSTERYILLDYDRCPLPDIFCEPVDIKWAEYIHKYSVYKDLMTIPYIEDRLSRGISAGYFKKGKLVAWALTHDDESLGSLMVLPDFRRQGLGEQIIRTLVNINRKLNKPSFLNIDHSNDVSRRLVKKCGFEFDRNISWIKTKT
ncbi:MAG TPA: GNAT family N-acetyltransferase, partial [Candidatus Marinimicrobia bacterium]|nr:GNAT family N-acetyltransferase [Candidatus Neomarinimicrobiota bacterium]